MEAISQESFENIVLKIGVIVSAPEIGIGRQMTFGDIPIRVLNLIFGDDDDYNYVSNVVKNVLEIEKSWYLINRFGKTSLLGLVNEDCSAILFQESERATLNHYLCTRSMDLGKVSSDLYVLSETGSVLVTWDHHTASEGLQIEIKDIPLSSELLKSLNNFGVEMQVYYSNE